MENKTILITGGTGSLGQELTNQILRRDPKKVIIYSRGELAQVEMSRKHDKRVRFFVGDVRDVGRLRRAFKGVELVIHAAALKHIDICAFNPLEAIKTNIIGAQNIVDASIDLGVEKVIAVSSDKACLDYFAPVMLADGSTMKISNIVNNKLDVEVKTWTPSGIKNAKVVGWHKNKLAGRKMFKVTYKNSYKNAGMQTHAVVTEDHLILTIRGWIEAGNIKKDDRLITSELMPTKKQTEIIIGGILGDSFVSRHKRSRISFSHCVKQVGWLVLKYNALKSLGTTGISSSRDFSSYRFDLSSNPSFTVFREQFYKNGRKDIPKNLVSDYFTPLMIATWYMDDGCLGGKNARIATHGFKIKSDVEWLADKFNEIGMGAYVYGPIVDNKKYFELRFTVKGTKKLFDLISAYIPPSMRYKILDTAIQYDPELWETGEPKSYITKVKITPFNHAKKKIELPLPQDNKNKTHCKRGHPLSGSNLRIISQTGSRQCLECVKINNHNRRKEGKYFSKDVYCLDVEDTHNFIVNGVVVHNCNPINLYGATKLCADKLFIASNAYSGKHGTQFAVVRFGNFENSNGSVIPYWKKLIKEGAKSLPMTDPDMTRFFISLEDAAAFTLRALNEAQAGEIWCPKMQTYSLLELALSLSPGIGFKHIGKRPGEKKHEAMIVADDADRTYAFPDYYITLPEFDWMQSKTPKDGIKVAERFEYASG